MKAVMKRLLGRFAVDGTGGTYNFVLSGPEVVKMLEMDENIIRQLQDLLDRSEPNNKQWSGDEHG